MKKILFAVLSACLFTVTAAFSQSVPCPPNIDFETGTTNWNFYVGTCCPLVANTPTTAIPCRHTITTSAGLSGCTEPGAGPIDQYGGFPVVDPSGATQSLRLGNTVNGAQAEKARYYVTVPTGPTSYALIYRYAVVFQNPSHAPSQQPRFETNAFDTTTGWTPVTGAHHTYIAGGVLPGFVTLTTCPTCIPAVTSTQPVQYRSWATATINLTGLGGHVIAADFMNGDCAPAGHFSYSYVDMTCGLFAISTVLDCDTTYAELKAPAGYETTSWFDSASMAAPLAAGESAWLPVSGTAVTYAAILTPYPGFGSPDTLYSRLVCSACSGMPGTVATGSSTLIAGLTTPVTLDLPGYPFVPGLTYRWYSSPDSSSWTAIPGATDSVYSFTGLTATTYFRCGITCTATGITTMTTGRKIETVANSVSSLSGYDSGAAIFPNPATDMLTIFTGRIAYTSYTIANAVGSQLAAGDMAGVETTVNVKALPAGVYYLTLKGGDNSEVLKFVK